MLLDEKFEYKRVLDQLAKTDAVMIRAVEDLIITLVRTKVIDRTTVPAVVWQHMLERKNLRSRLQELKALICGL
jgi:hypothetical protein